MKRRDFACPRRPPIHAGPQTDRVQAPTHILAGVVIQKSFDWKKHRVASLTLTAVVAFLSHGFLDKLARVTYHRADPDFHSAVWVAYHLTLIVVTVVFLCVWWKPYKWGIIFATLPDVDWVFIHGQEIFHVRIPFYRQPHLHNLLHLIFDRIPPFTWIDKLPNDRQKPWAALWEVLLVVLLLVTIRLMDRAKRRRAVGGS